MKVQFITNVGTRDATVHGLDHTKCTGGSVHDFPEDKARALIDSKLVHEFTRESAEAQENTDATPAPPTPANFQQNPHQRPEEKPRK